MSSEGISKKQILKVIVQHQKEMTWCWAAVGSVCALYYYPDSGWTQCKLASSTITPSPGNCCASEVPAACNRTYYLNNKQHTGSLVTAGIDDGFQEGAITQDVLIGRLDKEEPVAYRLAMYSGTLFHFVIISGYQVINDKTIFTVDDSFFGSAEIIYDEFVKNYKNDGKVTHTFFTAKKKA